MPWWGWLLVGLGVLATLVWIGMWYLAKGMADTYDDGG